MPERPLLVFPTPAPAQKSRLHGGGEQPDSPGRERQEQRLGDRLQTLANDLRRSALQRSLTGASSEKILVLEVAGAVDTFADAAQRLGQQVPGLEWLAEWAQHEREPDDDFHFTEKDGAAAKKRLQPKLYLVSSNLQGLVALESLWRAWQTSADGNLPRGLAPFRDVFNQLADIRFWDAGDRIAETGIIEAWRDDVRHFPNQPVRCEVEFWYRNTLRARQNAETAVTDAVAAGGGRIISRCDLPDIRYHAQLVELPLGAAEAFVHDIASLAVVRCDEVMFLRPVGQAVRLYGEDDGLDVAALLTVDTASAGQSVDAPTRLQPRVAILDGLPIEQHNLLAGRLIVDNPDEVDYAVEHRRHGTAMASLVVNGDAATASPLPEPVYLRPVLACDERSHVREEAFPRDRLVPDFIHECIVRMRGAGPNTVGTAPLVRIVNLSLGDRGQPFLRTVSPWARLLDWLSWKYGLLFVVSAGNYKEPLSIDVDERTLLAMPVGSRHRHVLEAISLNRRQRTLLAPAETVNGLAVGAANVDPVTSTPTVGHLDLYDGAPLPSVVSANGLGFRRSVKPDLLMPGGRLAFRFHSANSPLALQLPAGRHGPRHAGPGRSGQLDNTSQSYGTSHAAALATRAAAQSLTVLDALRLESESSIPSGFEALFAKTVLVHGARWGEARGPVEAAVRRHNTRQHQSDQVARFIGYGLADVEWALSCTDRRAVVLGFGTLTVGQAHRYELPVPSGLFTGTVRRRLVTTLAWFSPIRPTSRKYRAADLWADLKPAELGVTSTDVDDKAAGRGTVEHHVYEGARAVVQPKPTVTIQVNCREDAAPLREAVKYVLMVTLEALEAVPIDVYVTMQVAIRDAIRLQERERIGRLG